MRHNSAFKALYSLSKRSSTPSWYYFMCDLTRLSSLSTFLISLFNSLRHSFLELKKLVSHEPESLVEGEFLYAGWECGEDGDS